MIRKSARLARVAKNVFQANHRLGRRLSRRYYRTARAYYIARLRFKPLKDPILVYTVGKVGTTAVAQALMASGTDRPIHHIHWLAPQRLAQCDAFYRAADRRYAGTHRALRFRPEFVWLGQYLSRRIDRDPARQWQVITLVRDPVARNVSAFFQNLDSFFDYWIDQELPTKGPERVARELVQVFLNAYVKGILPTGMDGDPLSWFGDELEPVLGVDVFRKPFPWHKGFEICESSRARVLLLRLEDLDRCANEALQEFIGLENYRTSPVNTSEGKAYASVHRRLLELIQLPDEYLDRLYTSKYCSHFYSPAELARFRAKWQGDRQ